MAELIDLSKIPKNQQSEDICLAAVKKNGYSLKFVKTQTPEICLAAVNQLGLSLQFVKTQTPEICLAAVKNNGSSLQHVINQTEEICLAAVQRHGDALKFVKNQSTEICLAAVKKDGLALYHTELQTPEICLAAVKTTGRSLYYVDSQTPEICLAAVKNSPEALIFSKFLNDDIFLAYLLHKEFKPLSLNDIFDRKNIQKDNCNSTLFSDIENIKNKTVFNDFIKNPIEYCANILSSQSLEYVSDLKNKIPDIFESNIYLMAVYEKMKLEQSINLNGFNNNNKNKIKKF